MSLIHRLIVSKKFTRKDVDVCIQLRLSHVKVGWKSCIFCSLTPLIAAILLAPPPPVTAGRRASGKKTPGAPPPTH